MIFLYIILILIGCVVLVKSADLVIKNLTKIAAVLHWSEFVVSFVIVAVTTSLPEIAVGLVSAVNQIPSLSLGNVIGANIINLTLILGLVAIISNGLSLKTKGLEVNVIFAIILSFLPMLFALDGILSRLDGLIILICFILYLILMFKIKEEFKKEFSNHPKREFLKFVFQLVLGLILLVLSAQLITNLVKILAAGFNLSPIFIGLLIVSLGTTLPELTFGVRAAIKKHQEMSLGSSLGTIVTNSCLALGLAAVIYPIQIINLNNFLMMFGFLILASLIFAIFIYSKKQLSLKEGVALVIFYIVFVIFQIFSNRP